MLNYIRSSDTPTLHLSPLLILASLPQIPQRLLLRGPCNLDPLILCPGLHQQCGTLHNGEYPTTAAMTTGYVFRIENAATVAWLQSISSTGHLTTVRVAQTSTAKVRMDVAGIGEQVLYLTGALLTLIATASNFLTEDYWALLALLTLIASRSLNTLVLQRRLTTHWHGALEPGVQGDLLVLLSQDRWIRLRGAVDALKALTSGSWMREPTAFESFLLDIAQLLVYVSVGIVAPNATPAGNLGLIGLLLVTTAALAGANVWAKRKLRGNGCRAVVEKVSGRYGRRRDLAEEMVREVGRGDWAVRLGMLRREDREGKAEAEGVTM